MISTPASASVRRSSSDEEPVQASFTPPLYMSTVSGSSSSCVRANTKPFISTAPSSSSPEPMNSDGITATRPPAGDCSTAGQLAALPASPSDAAPFAKVTANTPSPRSSPTAPTLSVFANASRLCTAVSLSTSTSSTPSPMAESAFLARTTGSGHA